MVLIFILETSMTNSEEQVSELVLGAATANCVEAEVEIDTPLQSVALDKPVVQVGSAYESYAETHKNYDQTRLAVGCEQVVRLLAKHFALPELRLLDAGCGTGLHLRELLESKVGSRSPGYLIGLDASMTGLQETAAKLTAGSAQFPSALHGVTCADMRVMPFLAASFDSILFSYCLHHLNHETADILVAQTKQTINEAFRLLAPGGRVLIITCTPEQLSPDKGSLWYYKYFPQAANRLMAKFLSAATWQQVALDCGFQDYESQLIEKTYWTEAGQNPQGPFDSAWRNGDSMFSLCRRTENSAGDSSGEEHEDELVAGLAQLKLEIVGGEAQKHIAAVRQRTEHIKQGVLISLKKPVL
jgi:ubiquinone/menaquinone biosynthesis C-methylase UbiE